MVHARKLDAVRRGRPSQSVDKKTLHRRGEWNVVMATRSHPKSTPDRNGSPARAEGHGSATVNGFHADLNVTLDLRNLREGTYYLATTHEGDAASYFYPLTLQ